MKILFLTNLLPYPLDNGGKIKTYTTIDTLAKEGHQIDLVCFSEQINVNKNSQEIILKLCNRVEQVYQRLTTAENKKYMLGLALRSLFSVYSFGLYKYRSREMKKILNDLCSKNSYDCVYFDHLQMCVYRNLIFKLLPNAKFILDEHNCEAVIMVRNAKTSNNILKKLFLQFEGYKLGKFESKMLKTMNANIVLSNEDYIELKKQCGEDFKHTIISIGVQDRGRKKETSKSDILNIMFLGTLTWEPNNQGLIWFLSQVMPLLIKDDINFHLYIVGKNPSADVKKLSESYQNITITGYVESVDEYYDKCDCMIVPLFIGSGQRVKLIEGFSKGMPSISTSVGAEGLLVEDGVNILLADEKEAFEKAVLKFKDAKLRKLIGDNARLTYENNYSSNVIAKKIIITLNEVTQNYASNA